MGNRINQTLGTASCGPLNTGSILVMGIAASAIVKSKSGRFVVGSGSGYVSMMTATAVDVMGVVDGNFEETANATAGVTEWPIETDFLSKLYVIPACKDSAAAVTEANLLGAIGYTFDIQMVNTSYQYADLGASAIDILLGYGYIYEGSAIGQQYMIVKVNHDKVTYTTHTDI